MAIQSAGQATSPLQAEVEEQRGKAVHAICMVWSWLLELRIQMEAVYVPRQNVV